MQKWTLVMSKTKHEKNELIRETNVHAKDVE